ncbi:MAG: hypothetical protein ACOCZ9_01160, partial [Spirochaetota bacterium]
MWSYRGSAVRRWLEIAGGALVLLLAASAPLVGQDPADETDESGGGSVELSVSSEVIRGEPFVATVSFSDASAALDVEEVSLALIDPDGSTRSSNVAFARPNAGEAGEWRAVVGVPSTATAAQ